MREAADGRVVDTGTDHLLCRVEDRVAVLTLNRPERRNSLSVDLKSALLEQVLERGRDPDVGCLLLIGAGRGFCSGGDTQVMATTRPPSVRERTEQLRGEHELPAAIFELHKPVLAALPGAAAGAGLGLALACDLRIASDNAFLVTSYVNVGLSGDYGASWFLTRLVGPALAREMFFLSERVDAQECLRLGLFNRVVGEDRLEEEALTLARRLAAGPPIALRSMKQNLNRALTADLRTTLDHEAVRMVRGAFTDDYREALDALSEKRAPHFSGR